MKKMIIMLIVVTVALTICMSCDNQSAISKIQITPTSNSKLSVGQQHNQCLDDIYNSLMSDYSDGILSTNPQNINQTSCLYIYEELNSSNYVNSVSEFNSYVYNLDTYFPLTNMDDDSTYTSIQTFLDINSSLLNRREYGLIVSLLEDAQTCISDKESITLFDTRYNEAINKGYNVIYPFYFNNLDIAHSSMLYWKTNSSKWDLLIDDIYTGVVNPYDYNNLRNMWMNDLRGAIIGGLTGTAIAGPTGTVIGIIVGAVAGSSNWKVQFAVDAAAAAYGLIED